MSDDTFDVEGWLRRIGHSGPREPVLSTLRTVIAAHTATIPFENIDILLGRPPKLDLGSLQQKLVANGRGGFCFALVSLLPAGLASLCFCVTRLPSCVLPGMAAQASPPAPHNGVPVDLP